MLADTLLHTADLPAADRFDRWRDHLSQTYVPTELTCEDTTDFTAAQRLIGFGAVQLLTVAHPALTLRRTPELIRRSDPGLLHLSLPHSGTVDVTSPHGTYRHRPGDVVVQDTSHPARMTATPDAGPGQATGTCVFVPKELLPLPAGDITEAFAGRRLSHRSGPGALLGTFLGQLLADTASFSPSDAPRLERVFVDLVTALLCHALDTDSAVARDVRHRTLVLRVKDHLSRHLHDPGLSPGAVAAAHHISLSHLHRLFRGEETTVAAWIRARRLERVRRDLADPALGALPIHAVAARWGLVRPADFSRAFRAAYGMPPRDFRARAAQEAATDS
ncbi:AraC-like ligand-binding domain-containing protein [Streptomyces aureocirculatus]|uniref:AraC-like ligand-binding domain-containing protein n=1 Tax=Streptomyces aureocirculatus TaxID=67275 RepID=UPI0004C5F626|nr:helix-turn-helix domain-containing protein [Streptomyces aureocirculatus]